MGISFAAITDPLQMAFETDPNAPLPISLTLQEQSKSNMNQYLSNILPEGSESEAFKLTISFPSNLLAELVVLGKAV